MKIIKLDLIVGARPNFVKMAAVIRAIEKKNTKKKLIEYRLVHTGQHYDENMSKAFFRQLEMPEPHFNLNAGGGTQAEQTAAIMTGYEKLLFKDKPDLCVVAGDVTSTLACAITAKKMLVPVAHIEGGIRSGDMTMPEEINRIVTDSITDYFFTTSETANENLRKSGVEDERIFFVGNTMIDTLLANRHRFVKPDFWDKAGLKEKEYLVITLHRPANVDEANKLKSYIDEIIEHSDNLKLVFPVHPRTAKMMKGLNISHPRLIMCEPQGYLEFNYLVEKSLAVITDSGWITEETTVMGIPCITLRNNTERPETVTVGTNELIGTNPEKIKKYLNKLLSGKWKKGTVPPLWDGLASERIIGNVKEIFKK